MVADVGVALGEQAQHFAVTDRLDSPQTRGAQRGDGGRPGVVGIVLVRVACGQQPRSGCERGGHVDDGLARRDELLGEQIAESAGRLDRPRTRRERFRPRHQLLDLAATGAHLLSVELFLAPAYRYRGVRRLVRINTDHHCHGSSGVSCDGPRRALLLQVRRARSSFEPHRGEIPAGRSSFDSQTGDRSGSAGTSRATPQGPLDATDHPQRMPEVSSRHFGDARADLSAARYETRVLVGAALLRPRPIGRTQSSRLARRSVRATLGRSDRAPTPEHVTRPM
jgi:hypothetical protein